MDFRIEGANQVILLALPEYSIVFMLRTPRHLPDGPKATARQFTLSGVIRTIMGIINHTPRESEERVKRKLDLAR